MADHPFTGTLNVTGNVGIGTEPSPNAQLYIQSMIAPSQVFLESEGTLLKLSVNKSVATLATDSNFPLKILTNNTSGIEIDAVGKVGIGTTTTLAEKLEVNGNIKATSFLGNGATLDGIVNITGPLTVKSSVKANVLQLQTGGEINEISSDSTFGSPSDRAVPTNKAVKTYVDGALATKANLDGASTQDFAAKNLTVQNKLTVIGNLDVTGTTTFRNIEQHQGDLELGNQDADRVRIHGVVNSTHSSGTLQIGSPLKVTGTVTAAQFIGDGSGLTGLVGTTQWSNGASGSIYYNNGNVGIGTKNPQAKLEVNGTVKATYFQGDASNLSGIVKAEGTKCRLLCGCIDENGNSYNNQPIQEFSVCWTDNYGYTLTWTRGRTLACVASPIGMWNSLVVDCGGYRDYVTIRTRNDQNQEAKASFSFIAVVSDE